MVDNIMGNGSIIRCMDVVFSLGLMEGSILESMLMTRRRVMAYSSGIYIYYIYILYIRPDGKKYDGKWLNGKQHGKGTYYSVRGEKREGVWKDGKREKWLKEGE